MKVNLPFEFPNKFSKMGGTIQYEDGSIVPTLAWVGLRVQALFSETVTRETLSDRIPQYMIIAPGVNAYAQDGSRRGQILDTHEVWFSMS